MLLKFLNLNHAGLDPQNPVVTGFALRVKFHKHKQSETLKHCWVTLDGSGNKVFLDLTSRVVTLDEEFRVDLVLGVDLLAATPARLNVINFTTTEHVHVKGGIYVVDRPPNEIKLDGYNAENGFKPLIVPVLQ